MLREYIFVKDFLILKCGLLLSCFFRTLKFAYMFAHIFLLKLKT